MKNFTLSLFVVFIFGKGFSQTTIVSDDFENSLTLFTATGSGAFYSGISDVGDRPASSAFTFSNIYSFGVTNGSSILTSNPINTAAYSSVQLTLKLASFSIANINSGADNTDYVIIEISPDGGLNYYPTVQINGNNNATWSYTGGTGNATALYDGDALPSYFAPVGGGDRTTDGYSTITITSLPDASDLRVRISLLNNFAAERWVIDNFEIKGTLVTGPLINILPFSLPGFTAVSGSPSTEKTYQVRGSGLTNDIVINAPVGFQVSATSGSGFGSSVTLTQSGGTVANTTIYARMNSTVAGSNTAIISNTSTGATTKNVTVSGNVFAVEPTVTSTISFANITTTSMGINFTGGNGVSRMVVIREGSPVISTPVDGINYPANSIYSYGSYLTTGEYVVYNGTGSTVNVTALNEYFTYYVAVFEYNDEGIIAARNYFTAPGTGNATTLALTPIAQGLELTTVNSIFKIDFDNTVARVNNGSFSGVTLSTTPAAGQLNSNAWSVSGTNFSGTAVFGGTTNTGGGISAGNVTGGTYYAFEPAAGNRILGIQPTASYWTPGNITLLVQNTTGAVLDSLAISFKLYILNNEDRGNAFYFGYSRNNVSYISGNAADTSVLIADASPVWKVYLRSVILRGLNIPSGGNVYLQWSGDDDGGSSTNRDEFGLDDISMVANPTTVYPRIAGSFENVIVRGRVQLSGNTSVTGNVILASQNIELGNNNLTIGGNASGSVAGYLQTNGTGNVTINNITTARLFPIGVTTYNPVTISSGSGLNWTVNVNNGLSNVQPPFNTNKAVLRSWTITPSVNPPSAGANLLFEYNDGDALQVGSNYSNTEDVQVWHFGGTNWTTASGAITSTGTPGNTRTVTLNNWSRYSSFAIANLSGPLPVLFGPVKAERVNRDIKITWANLTESNITYYAIERSLNGIQFTSIGQVTALLNNGDKAEYNWVDMSPGSGANFYRIRAIESGGKIIYSKTVKLNIAGSDPELLIYPNPVRGSQTYLVLSDLPKGNYAIKIFTNTGQQIQRELLLHPGGSVAMPLLFPAITKAGIYVVQVEGEGFKLHSKIIKQ